MKNRFKYLGYGALSLVVVAVLFAANLVLQPYDTLRIYLSLGPEAEILISDGVTYRDLNKNQHLDVYENAQAAPVDRVEDLLSQMTLEEKVGQMMHPAITIKPDFPLLAFHLAMGRADIDASEIVDKHVTHFNFYGKPTPLEIAEKLNKLQKVAARTRLGIPLTISSDPLHEAASGGIAAFSVKGFSGWPSQLGFAASRDIDLMRRFGEIAAAEYRAVGLQTALHPMADLATEPRWARNFGTFGSNAQLSGEMTNAYMLGFQGATLTGQSVMTMVKHFPGGGPQEFGLDAHLPSGKRQVYPGNNFDYHVEPFKKAIANGLRVIMPYYGVPVGQTNDDVAMGYNKMILTDLLRDELGFTGVVCTDWGIVSSRAWGVEGLTIRERYKKSIDAGVDQYGGESDPEHIIDMVNSGELTVERIDESVRRILINKFDLGLFEQAMVDEGLVDSLVRKPEYISAGLDAQRKSIVLLKNEASKGRTLPAAEGKRIFIDGLDVDQAKSFGNVVSSPDQADIIILYLPTVFNGNQAPGSNELIDKFLSGILPDGDLTYGSDILKKAKTYADYATLITVVDLNRPAILTELNKFSDGLIGIFGVYDSILYEVIFGQFSPQGKLPFEIPSSMESVENQKEDLPDDSESPIFEFGHGLTY